MRVESGKLVPLSPGKEFFAGFGPFACPKFPTGRRRRSWRKLYSSCDRHVGWREVGFQGKCRIITRNMIQSMDPLAEQQVGLRFCPILPKDVSPSHHHQGLFFLGFRRGTCRLPSGRSDRIKPGLGDCSGRSQLRGASA